MSTKLIVSHRGALLQKYGPAGLSTIESSIHSLTAVDQQRGLTSCLIYLDDASALGESCVSNRGNAQQFKDAIDALFGRQRPDYLMLLGSTDVIPFQPLSNPLYDDFGDTDALAAGDLPYACDTSYSTQIIDFVGPTRVLSRLPDLTGASEPTYLLNLLAAAARNEPKTLSADYFGLTAQVWEDSTRASLISTFGQAEKLNVAPPRGPEFDAALLAASFHFVNCHGAPADSRFYGQHGSDYPIALNSEQLTGIAPGTAAAFECCYGGELYDPFLAGGTMSIANRYLEKSAAAVLASTTIAYGPASGNAQADLICQYFLQSVMAGASIGRALLEARQKYVRNARLLTPVDLKTLAQFILLGDPSTIVVSPSVIQPHLVAARRRRRIHLRELGITLMSSVAVTQRSQKTPTPPRVQALLKAELRKMLRPASRRKIAINSFAVRRPADREVKGLVLPAKVHVALTKIDALHPGPALAGLIAIEHGDKVDLQPIFSR